MGGLLAVVEVGFEELRCVWGKIEFVSEFADELFVADCVIGFAEVDIDGKCGFSLLGVVVEVVGDGLEG